MKEQHKKIAGLSALIIFIGVMVAAFFLIGEPLVAFVNDPEAFRSWRQEQGLLAPIAFVMMVALQVVVAIIPGEPFEICAGFAFGSIWGTLLCLSGIVLGSVIIFALVRKWGSRLVELIFSRDKINSIRFLRSGRKRNTLIFLIMMIPGTPKDLLTYFVGLTDIRLREWVVIAAVARIPSVITSAVGGNLIAEQRHVFAVMVFLITGALSIAGLILYNHILKKNEQSLESQTKQL